jgi:endo-1,3-1,4-beta-glycanase ExoK
MSRGPSLRCLNLLLWACVVGAGAGCASTPPSTGGSGGVGGQSGTGGSSATGGTTTSSGATGGSTTAGVGGAATGGRLSTGGDTGTSTGSGGNGGIATGRGGQAAGGAATGGASARGGAGGTASGGNTGGAATGGAATGGTASGGKAGSATGGSATGGSALGGIAGGGSGGNPTSGSGGNPTGGSGGSPTGGSGAGGGGGDDPFALAWQDDFNTLDTALWQAQSFTWEGNQAQFTPQNVWVASGKLTISLTNAPSGSAKPYLGVELRSTKTLTYGKVSANMRFASGSGVVSGLVLFYTPYPNCDWNEIDIEHLGNSSKTSQVNCQVYVGTPVPSCTTSVAPTQDPEVVNLGVDAEAAFHQYDIEWTPAGVKFFVDGTLLRTWTANISLLKLPQNILLTIWASNAASWAGPLNATSAPTSAEVDWIKVYSWKG